MCRRRCLAAPLCPVRWGWAALAGAAGLAVVLAPGQARALAEDDWMLAGSVGVGLLDGARDAAGAWALGAEAQHGLTDAFALRLGLHHGRALSASSPPAAPAAQIGLEAGLAYAIDVVRVVPSAELGLGVDWVRGGGDSGGQAIVAAGVAADYLVNRRLSVGLALRGRQALLRLGSDESLPLFQSLFFVIRVGATYW